MLIPVLVLLSLPRFVYPQSSKVPLYLGSMAPLSGSRTWWGAGITAAMEMAFEYINNRTDILPSYELKLLANDTRGETGLGNRILFEYISAKRPLLVLGPGRSNVALSVADTSKYWKMIQISASAESGYLSDSRTYPYFFRTISSVSASKSTFVALAKRFGWSRVSILFYSRDMYRKAASELKEECNYNNITVLSYGSFLDRNDADQQLKHIKDIDSRIVFAFLQRTTSVMCLIYKHGLFGRKRGWIVHTPDSYGWWNRTYRFLDCSVAQVRKAADYAIYIDHMYISKQEMPTISGLTPQQFSKAYEMYVKSASIKSSQYGPFGFDAAWLAALALNSSIDALLPEQRVNALNLDYLNATDIIKENVLQSRFKGVTGDVCLEDNGDRSGKFEIFQLRDNNLNLIAFHAASRPDNLSFYSDNDFMWRGRKAPRDHVVHRDALVQLSDGLFIAICIVASIGILLCFAFLLFNVVNRKRRFIKMSSPNINNAIIVGCLLAYISVILFSVDGDRLTSLICKVKAYTLDIAFTIAFGSLFSKTWRVYRITRKLTAKRKVIKDIHLFGMIFVFLFVDVIIIVVWTAVDPLRKDKKYLHSEVNEQNTDVIFKPMVYYCSTNHPPVWLTLIYGFKAILLMFGLFLAWETRKVKIAALNDSQHIGLAVYNVFTICTIAVPVIELTDSDQHEVSFVVTVVCILFCTTLTLCLVFVPKMVGLYKRNNPEIANGCGSQFKYSNGNLKDVCDSKEFKNAEAEVQKLRRLLEKTRNERDALANKVPHFESKPSCLV